MENMMSEVGFDIMDVLQLLYDQDNKGVMVEFTKKDGTDRKMLCTLAATLIPDEAKPKTPASEVVSEEVPQKTPEAQRVYDLEKQAWRSFRWDSVKFFQAIK